MRISQKVFTQHLKNIKQNALLNRKVYAEVPPRVEYSLTETGYSLKYILDAIWNWGEGYKANLK
ncbi:winged helix-turn-helix transcriptional regulator [Clostridium botulinum]|uniref:Winged helix-turn-helix transcriptional regulator n=1 Tax=Clostridium botulinum TaxID=1491 RepID=A0A846J5C9_CLOBO|nr:winged helix-turn-helix transcriptional regulator [Clostridium botulinum]NFJ07257.1 winged helix-turn-helix transcriptional regulator [Clostridium botulinum]NFK14229.1 winged helix-turn-helix transcriptional regulator [Clostridium botulinum]NFM92115.1 winged helix-turn-helix transcriptional regulator [Clostridium botulinum]NFO16008.1 winged helix-turn-helix transcriptional regulator [Clostridium botulinum]